MTSDFNARFFDKARVRDAPDSISGHWSNGTEDTVVLTEVTLVVAIKSHCDGCRDFLNADLDHLHLPVVIISADDDVAQEWNEAINPVLVSPDAFRLLDVRWPPLYVLIDPISHRVLTEGVLFGSAQVAREIAPYLNT